MKIVKETERKVVGIRNYVGICDGCGTSIEYEDELIVIEIFKDDSTALLVPIDVLSCPECSKTIGTIKVYDLDVTKELGVHNDTNEQNAV